MTIPGLSVIMALTTVFDIYRELKTNSKHGKYPVLRIKDINILISHKLLIYKAKSLKFHNLLD